MKERARAAILLAVTVFYSLAPGVYGFHTPKEQAALGIPKSAVIFAWSIISIYSIVMAAFLFIRKVNYAGITIPLILAYALATFVLVTDAQGWWWISFVLSGLIVGALWRAFYVLTKHRDQVTFLGQILVTTPVAIVAGWSSVAMVTRLADAMWNSGIPREGTLATAWQAILILVIVFAGGFGIEASRAHPAFAAAVVWASIHVVIAVANTEQGVLTAFALFSTLVVLALFFIERAMFRGPREQRVSR